MDRLERQQSETQERLIQHDMSRQESVDALNRLDKLILESGFHDRPHKLLYEKSFIW